MASKSATFFLLLFLVTFTNGCGGILADDDRPNAPKLTPDQRERALAVLREGLSHGRGWVKVHAAEALLRLDYPQSVREHVEAELPAAEIESGYRIGVWQTLALQAGSDTERAKWISRILGAALDPSAGDKQHALEALAKLEYTVEPGERQALREAAESNAPLAAYARWVLASSGTEADNQYLAQLFDSPEESNRTAAAYALRNLKKISPTSWAKLEQAADSEPAGSAARIYLVSAAFVHAPNETARAKYKPELLKYVEKDREGERVEACAALAIRGVSEDLPRLEALLDDPDTHVRVIASSAILRIGRRVPHRMAALDWVVVFLYCLSMIAVSWYYSRRTASTEGYLLGDRRMKPWAIGISIFATLWSTIGYLSSPGEMIRYGPMIFAGVAVFPLIYLAVGWFLIPSLMKLRVTSAYEILEARLGLSIRMLGSIIFLALRLLWMSVITYATTSKVLIPLLGLDPRLTPWLCALMVIITVSYTSIGGLRAVVFTSVAQTIILFAGAILIFVTITSDMGGIGAWWPRSWAENWQAPAWIDPNARITFVGVWIATFTWYFCTSGSDQMVIQRYLSTRDPKAARRAYAISLVTDALVGLFLGALGLALVSYFQTHPHMVPDGQTIQTNADQLLPQYVVFGLPAGVSGLVIAGLLATAMDSLSSGVNSSCAVVSADFMDRFRTRKISEYYHVRMAKCISVLVGAVVIVLSLYVSVVPGNLVEVAYRVVNLFVAPLFVLFFLALFVRWSTTFGTWLAAISSIAVAVAIAYWELITGNKGISFLWIMPCSLVVGVTVGTLASLLPIGPGPRPTLAQLELADAATSEGTTNGGAEDGR